MLTITIPANEGTEYFDDSKQEFIRIGPKKEVVLQIEHSLISLSKWESKWKVPFLERNPPKTDEQTIDYIRCMTITQNVNPEVYNRIPPEIFPKILEYIQAPMSATWFSEAPKSQGGKTKSKPEVLTSEIIYYKMISHNIPMECQKWHLNRLITLIRVFNLKNSSPKKMNKKQMLEDRRAQNKARRDAMNSKG